jgi:hypothetical protein
MLTTEPLFVTLVKMMDRVPLPTAPFACRRAGGVPLRAGPGALCAAGCADWSAPAFPLCPAKRERPDAGALAAHPDATRDKQAAPAGERGADWSPIRPGREAGSHRIAEAGVGTSSKKGRRTNGRFEQAGLYSNKVRMMLRILPSQSRCQQSRSASVSGENSVKPVPLIFVIFTTQKIALKLRSQLSQ